jgi:hypothetical protein
MKSKHLAMLPGAVAAAIAAIALLAPVAQAATPAPGYEQFTGCPSPAEKPSIVACLHSVVKSGHFDMGNKEVPITNPIPLTGGVEEELKGFSFNSQGGLAPVKQKVPGGVIGLTGLTFLLEILGSEALTLYAVTELAGTPTFEGVTQISLPIKVHLINGVLGNKCYIGSNSNPINLQLTTGTTSPPPPNEPITGKNPKASFDFTKQIQKFSGGVYVDNSFAAPGASGCVLTLFGFIPVSINGAVNSASGLPAAAGTNETVQEIDTEVTPASKVYP